MTEATEAKPGDDALLTTQEAAGRLKISRRLLYEYISAGEITTIRLPSRTGAEGEHRIEPAEIERFKQRHTQAATA